MACCLLLKCKEKQFWKRLFLLLQGWIVYFKVHGIHLDALILSNE